MYKRGFVRRCLRMRKSTSIVIFLSVLCLLWQLYLLQEPVTKTLKSKNGIYHLSPSDPMWSWLEQDGLKIGGVFHNYGHQFAYLHHVIVNSQNAVGKHGGENVDTVWNQKEKNEFIDLKSGFFTLDCKNLPESHFSRSYLDMWYNATSCEETSQKNIDDTVQGYTLAFQRYDYTSLYHTMLLLYNAFLTTLVLKPNPPINIFIVDSHPYNIMDEIWSTIFSKVVRAGHLSGKIMFSKMIWNIPEQNSLLLQKDRPLMPFIEEFRRFVFSAYNVSWTRNVTCGKLSLLCVWRRDYITHARNTKGHVMQKIVNEDELLSSIQKTFPLFEVNGYQMDSLSMDKQLKLMSQTDILIGMTGSGLTHALFLPQNGALIEVKSGNVMPAHSEFESLARWRKVRYRSLLLDAQENQYVYVPPMRVIDVIQTMVFNMC